MSAIMKEGQAIEVTQSDGRRQALTAADMRTHVNLVQEVMRAVMKADTHYGVIPGCKKPSLYKPGAEVLAATFRIAVSYKIDDLSTDDHVRYRVTAVGTHQITGIVLGEGMGECSTNEEKYKWRRVICDEEFESQPENRRRIKFSKYQGRVEKQKQVRTEPADTANTILKMACKRAQVAMTLNVTAASDIFTQDIEDLPEELRTEVEGDGEQRQTVMQPQSKSGNEAAGQQGGGKPDGPSPPASPGQINLINAKLDAGALSLADLLKHLGVESLVGITVEQGNSALAWCKNPDA